MILLNRALYLEILKFEVEGMWVTAFVDVPDKLFADGLRGWKCSAELQSDLLHSCENTMELLAKAV